MNTLLVLSLCFSSFLAEESFFKFRFHKDFIKDIFEKNLRMIFERTERLQMKDIYLQDLGTAMTNVKMSIQPRIKQWEALQMELLFDEDQIIMEMHDLEFSGQGFIQDPDSGARERVEFNAPIYSAQVILQMGEELSHWGSLYPRLRVVDVIFSIEEENVVVSAFGDLPLYKSHTFEISVK